MHAAVLGAVCLASACAAPAAHVASVAPAARVAGVDRIMAEGAGQASLDVALSVPARRSTQGLASDLGIGQVVVGLFDYGSAANDVARLGILTQGGYQNAAGSVRLDTSNAPWFGSAYTRSLPTLVGTPKAGYNSTRVLADTLTDVDQPWLDLSGANAARLEPRRYLIRDFDDGESILTAQANNTAISLRFGNLAQDDGSGLHSYLAFAVAWDANPNRADRKVLGYVDVLVPGPLKTGQNVGLPLVLNEGVFTDNLGVGFTLDPVVPTVGDDAP